MNNDDVLVKLLQNLVRIPSWVSDIESEKWKINENKLIDFIEKWLSQNTNLETFRQTLDYGRSNLIAYRGNPDVIFLAHTDTVSPPVDSKYPAFAGEVHDGRVWGRGSADMKSGIAALMQAAALSPDADNYAIFFYADEEYDFLGMKTLIRELSYIRPKYMISADGTDLKMGNGCRGLIEIRGRVIGESAHAALGGGKNAVMAVYKMISDLGEYFEKKSHPSMGKSSLNLAYLLGGKGLGTEGVFEGKLYRVGQEGNVVPDIAEFVIDIRPSSPEVSVELVTEILESSAEKLAVSLDIVNVRHNLGAWYTPREDIRDFEILAAKACKTSKIEFNDPRGGGYLDLQMLWEAVGKPVSLVFGAGSSEAEHTDNESVSIDSMAKDRDFFLQVMEKFC